MLSKIKILKCTALIEIFTLSKLCSYHTPHTPIQRYKVQHAWLYTITDDIFAISRPKGRGLAENTGYKAR